MVIVLEAHAAVTPAGRFVAVPIPVAAVVVCVIFVNAVLIHKVGVLDAVPAEKVIVAGHYCFSSPEYQAILDQISQHGDWTSEINQAMYQIFDNYTTNLQ